MKKKYIVSISLACILALLFCGVYLSRDLCSDEVLGEVGVSDGKDKVLVYVRDCGATTDFVTVVELHGRAALKVKGYHKDDLEVSCLSDKKLQIYTSAESDVIFQGRLIDGIEIELVKTSGG